MKRIFQILFLALFLLGGVAGGGVALAQSAAPEGQPAKDSEGFVPVNGDMMQPGESIPASRLVGLAYGFIFAAVLVYVASVARRSRRVEEEMDELKRKLQQKA
jgi:CcmD family protein